MINCPLVHLLSRELTMTNVSFRSIRDLIENICKNDATRFKRLPPMKGKGDATSPSRHDAQIESNAPANPRPRDVITDMSTPQQYKDAASDERRGYFTADTRTHLVRRSTRTIDVQTNCLRNPRGTYSFGSRNSSTRWRSIMILVRISAVMRLM